MKYNSCKIVKFKYKIKVIVVIILYNSMFKLKLILLNLFTISQKKLLSLTKTEKNECNYV